MYHKSVLLQESVDGLAIKTDGVYVDVTFGGGGHAKEILKRLGKQGRLIAFDQDKDALANALKDQRFLLINENFRFLKRFLRFYGILKVDGILADFGVSSHQFDVAARGFSTRLNGALDMRMDKRTAKSAFELINSCSEKELEHLFFEYGELHQAKGIARAIVVARSENQIVTTADLKAVISRFLPRRKENKTLAQVYQAIRIKVNDEISVLKEFLVQVPEVLHKGGRLSVISYHSLEDRLVKRFIRDGKFEGLADKDLYGNTQVPLKKIGKLLIPSAEEINNNNRARSAKLRIAERI